MRSLFPRKIVGGRRSCFLCVFDLSPVTLTYRQSVRLQVTTDHCHAIWEGNPTGIIVQVWYKCRCKHLHLSAFGLVLTSSSHLRYYTVSFPYFVNAIMVPEPHCHVFVNPPTALGIELLRPCHAVQGPGIRMSTSVPDKAHDEGYQG